MNTALLTSLAIMGLRWIGNAMAWFGLWLLSMVVALSYFYHPKPLWVTVGPRVLVEPACIFALGFALRNWVAKAPGTRP